MDEFEWDCFIVEIEKDMMIFEIKEFVLELREKTERRGPISHMRIGLFLSFFLLNLLSHLYTFMR